MIFCHPEFISGSKPVKICAKVLYHVRERNETKEREKRDQMKRVIRNYVSETSFF